MPAFDLSKLRVGSITPSAAYLGDIPLWEQAVGELAFIGGAQGEAFGQTVNLAHRSSEGSLLVVFVTPQNFDGVPVVTDNGGNTWQVAQDSTTPDAQRDLTMLYCEDAAAATLFQVATPGYTSGWRNAVVLEFSGVATSNALRDSSMALKSSSGTLQETATAQSGDLVLGGISGYAGSGSAYPEAQSPFTDIISGSSTDRPLQGVGFRVANSNGESGPVFNVAQGGNYRLITGAFVPDESNPLGAPADLEPDVPAGYQIVFNEDFDGPLDPDIWTVDVQASGEINAERQAYVDDPANVSISDSVLSLTAVDYTSNPYDDGTVEGAEYTSGKIHMKDSTGTFGVGGTGFFQYGYVVVKGKVPVGNGAWPAFWILGENTPASAPNRYWPTVGEIDIMESVNDHNYTQGTIHSGEDNAPPGQNDHWSSNQRFPVKHGGDWHLYAVKWEPGRIEWFYDNVSIGVKTKADDLPAGKHWAFDDYPECLIINLAVGGTWPEIDDGGGAPDLSTWPNKSLEVDYVRVYQEPAGPPEAPDAQPLGAPISAAYYPQWLHGSGVGQADPGDVNYDSLTHIIDFSVFLDPADSSVSNDVILDGEQTSDGFGNGWTASKANALVAAAHAAGTKALICLGSDRTSESLNAALDTAQKRATAASNLADFIELYDYDGIDLDPEPTASFNYWAELVEALGIEFDSRGWRSADANYKTISCVVIGYDGRPVSKLVIPAGADWITTMTYIPRNDFVNHISPIDPPSSYNVSHFQWMVDAYTEFDGPTGIDRSRLVMGMSYVVWRYRNQTTVGAASTTTDTYLNWATIAPHVGSAQWDATSRASYWIGESTASAGEVWPSYNSADGVTATGWHSFETEQSIEEKAGYIDTEGLGGIAVWNYPAGRLADGSHPLAGYVAEHFLGVTPPDPAGNFTTETVPLYPSARSYSVHNHSSSNNQDDVPAPAEVVAGDLLVLYTFGDTSNVSSAYGIPSGFTELWRLSAGNGGVRRLVSYKVATGGEPGAYPIVFSSGADGVSILFAIKDWDGNTSNIVFQRTGSATDLVAPSVNAAATRSVLLSSVGMDDNDTGATWGWIPPADMGLLTYGHNNGGWSSGAVAAENIDGSGATGDRTWQVNTDSTQTTRILDNVSIGAGSGTKSVTQFNDVTTAGEGGPLTDTTDNTFTDSTGLSSGYHLFADGLDWNQRVGLMVYTDGSGEFGLQTAQINSQSQYLLYGTDGLIAVAKRQNMVLLTPKAPGDGCLDGEGVCWYENSQNGVTAKQKVAWSDELIRWVMTRYDIDRRRIAIGGYSSGAQWTTQYFGPAYASEVMEDGVAVAISYGGSPRLTPNLTAEFKANVEFVWDVGDNDTSYTQPTWDDGVQSGRTWYQTSGFASTDLVLLSGQGHARDNGEFGQIMEREIEARVIPAAEITSPSGTQPLREFLFQEGSGTTAADTGTDPTDLTGVPGWTGDGMACTSTGPEMTIASGYEVWTLMGWFKPVSISGWTSFFEGRASGARWIGYVECNSSLRPDWFSPDGGGDLVGPNLTLGQWHHMAAVYDGATRYFYVDGVMVESGASTSANLHTSGAGMYVGLSAGSSAGETHTKDVRFFDEALDGTKVTEWMNYTP